jgi:hypothetical protein
MNGPDFRIHAQEKTDPIASAFYVDWGVKNG